MKYIITDPCYLIDNEKWQKCCKVFQDERYKDDDELVQQILYANIKFELKKKSKFAFVSSTGYGDWVNHLLGQGANGLQIISAGFCADAGMVCVVEAENFMELTEKNSHCFAIFETDEKIKVKVDKSNAEWYVVEIYNDKDKLIAHTERENNYEINF